MTLLFVIGGFVIGGLVIYATNWLALVPWRKTSGQHWTERARVLYPVRVSAMINNWLAAAATGLLLAIMLPDDWLVSVIAGIAALIGANLAGFSFARELKPWLEFKDWVGQMFSFWTLALFYWGVLVAVAAWMPDELSGVGLLAVAGAVVFQLWAVCGGLLTMVRVLKVLTPAPGHLLRIVNETAAHQNWNVKKVWLWHSAMSNAFALPATNELVFTTRLIKIAPDEEIAAITAHEVAHLMESRQTILARVSGVLLWTLWLFIKPAIHSFGMIGFNGLLLIFVIGGYLNRRLARRMEERADKLAVTDETSGQVYARALAHLYEDNMVPAVMPGANKVHPHLYDRLIAAGITPDFPRPKRPSYLNGITFFYITLVVFLAGIHMFNLTRDEP